MNIIQLPDYHVDDNPTYVVDTDEIFDNQSDYAKEYIITKNNATESALDLDDGHNRPSIRTYSFSDGFTVVFQQNYANNYSWLLDNEVVTSITVD